MTDKTWTRDHVLHAISAGTVQQKAERLKRAGILDASGKLAAIYQPQQNKSVKVSTAASKK